MRSELRSLHHSFWALLFCLGATLTGEAQPAIPASQTNEAVEWLTLEEALARNTEEERKILLDIYKPHCVWCRKMDQLTFNDPQLSAIINRYFYPVRINAHYNQDIEFNDRTYTAKKDGYHELVVELMRGRLSFPTIVFIDEDLNVIQPLAGFKTPTEFERISLYFAEDFYKKMPWSTYERKFDRMIRNE